MEHLFGINPPKISNNFVLFKEIRIFEFFDNPHGKLKTTFLYNTNGSVLKDDFSENDVKTFKELNDFNLAVKKEITLEIKSEGYRELWLFKTKEEAFYQKIICLKIIRDIFKNNETERRNDFDTDVSPEVENLYRKILETKPEYFL